MPPKPTPPKTAPTPREDAERRLDEALEETFPASDPIAPMSPRDLAPQPRRRTGRRQGG
jgi:hypothetical protein